MRPELRWNDLHRLREMTSLPIWIKGIHRVDDVEKALKAEVSGIIVSNHGGRQIDGGIGALHALDRIATHYKGQRSEERRVGKECRSGWWQDHTERETTDR